MRRRRNEHFRCKPRLRTAKPAHDEAIYFLAHRREYGLSLAERHDLMQVVASYTMGGSRDEAAVRRGIAWVREHYSQKSLRQGLRAPSARPENADIY